MTTPNRPPDNARRHCRQMFAHLSEYLDRELDASDCRRIEAHLKCCDACRACFETLAQTVALCHEMPARSVPEGMAARLRAAIARLDAASCPPEEAKPDRTPRP